MKLPRRNTKFYFRIYCGGVEPNFTALIAARSISNRGRC